jgi:hypothetical protein
MNKDLQSKLEKLENRHELLSALLFIGKDKWENAHEIAQKKEGQRNYDRIHALLHRIEGDEFNTKYWYRKINEVYERHSIAEEWDLLTEEYLNNYS